MSDWSWVFLGQGLTYASVVGYYLSLRHRRNLVRHELEERG